jgi:hypothetical protein
VAAAFTAGAIIPVRVFDRERARRSTLVSAIR